MKRNLGDNYSYKKFVQWKEHALNKEDKSHKNSIDLPIKELCNTINAHTSYFTLSSCSGRICIQELTHSKTRDIWKFKSHELISYDEIESSLETKSSLEFRQDSAILHVCCFSFDDAYLLIEKAKQTGWNQCSLIAWRRKLVVELITSRNLRVPLSNKGKLLVSQEYIQYLISIANTNLESSWDTITKLRESF